MKIYRGNTGAYTTVPEPEPIRAPARIPETDISAAAAPELENAPRNSLRRTGGTTQARGGTRQSGNTRPPQDEAASRRQRGNNSARIQPHQAGGGRSHSTTGVQPGGDGILSGLSGILGGGKGGGLNFGSLAGLAGLGGLGGIGSLAKLGNLGGIGKIGDLLNSHGFGSLLGKLNLSEFETEDIILALILYLLYRESEDEEFLIILAAMLFL